jgi:hypothetical protein
LPVIPLAFASMLSIRRIVRAPGIVLIPGGLPSVPNDDAEAGDGCVGQMTVSNGLALPRI